MKPDQVNDAPNLPTQHVEGQGELGEDDLKDLNNTQGLDVGARVLGDEGVIEYTEEGKYHPEGFDISVMYSGDVVSFTVFIRLLLASSLTQQATH